ncbi:unnamed protein product [Ophioblennius macclurei]
MSPRPRLLLLLPLLLLHLLDSGSSQPERHIGTEFLVAFPENIAYFHPQSPDISFWATAPFSDTKVTVLYNHDLLSFDKPINKSHHFPLSDGLELAREEVCNKSVLISSTKNISVFAASRKNNSVQTVLVAPTHSLGTRYLVPPVPSIQLTTSPATEVTRQVTEKSPFRIVIVNAGQANKVTLKGGDTEGIELGPYQVAQVWLDQGQSLQSVEAEAPVAVFFGHPCAVRKPCTCSQLYTALPPATADTHDFFIPPFLVSSISEGAAVLVSDGSGAESRAYSADSPVVRGASAALLYSPGLLLALIPESDLASCYMLGAMLDVQSYVVIMVKNSERDGVHLGAREVTDDWIPVTGTDYVAIRHRLQEVTDGRSVIWHAYSKMAVYFIGSNDGTQFGNPAPIISTTPDFRGCALVPEILHIGEVAYSWRESLRYCKDQGLELIRFPTQSYVDQVNSQLARMDLAYLDQVWIGMRRSSLTGDWYWAHADEAAATNRASATNWAGATNWAEGEPGLVEEGQCAMMSTERNQDFLWRDEDCCREARPLCTGPGTFITK